MIEHPKNTAFGEGIKELIAVYGKSYFNQHFTREAFDTIKDFSPKQIKNICYIVGTTCAVAPTLEDFRDVAAKLRDKIREFEREKERRDAHDFWAGTFHSSEVKEIVGTIKKRLMGTISDDEWFQFQKMLKDAADRSPPPGCKKCEDTGVYFENGDKMIRCECGKGTPSE